MSIKKENFGFIGNDEVFTFTLKNKKGMEVVLSNYGALIKNIFFDNNSKKIDLVLGYDNLEDYIHNPNFFGVTIGPNCNRISNSEFTLKDKIYKLEQNDGVNNLHSGSKGLHKVLWNYKISEEKNYVEFTYLKKDNEQGFPGNINIKVRYRLTESNELEINYQAQSNKDTIINLTNHSYFNLAGHQNLNAIDQYLWLNSNYFTPVRDEAAIPTGEIRHTKNTPMDFSKSKKISKDIYSDYDQLKFVGGYDHNFKIEKQTEGIELIAKLYSEDSNIVMQVYSDTPGVQFYSGNSIVQTPIGKEKTYYKKRSGVCLETQYFPDSINNINFKSPVLNQGEEYKSTTIYKFLTR